MQIWIMPMVSRRPRETVLSHCSLSTVREQGPEQERLTYEITELSDNFYTAFIISQIYY